MSYFQKPKIPYEIGGLRKWYANENPQHPSSSEADEDNYDPEDDWGDGTRPSSPQQQDPAATASTAFDEDDEGFQPVIRRFTKQHAMLESTRKPKVSKVSQTATTLSSQIHSSTTAKVRSSQNSKTTATYSQSAFSLPLTKTGGKILLNRSGQRIDPTIRRTPDEVKQVKELKLCNWHFLLDECRTSNCSQNHQYKPSQYELQSLCYIGRMSQCRYGAKCREPRCLYGHGSSDDVEKQNRTHSQSLWGQVPLMILNDEAPETQRSFPETQNGKAALITFNSSSPPRISSYQLPGSETPSGEHRLPLMSPQDARIRRPKPIFRFDRDNTARAAFRQRQAPTCTFPLHKGVIEIEPDLIRLEYMLADFGIRFRSFVRPPQSASDRELLIWGNQRQVSATVEGLRNWIHQSEEPTVRRSLPRDNFAREYSTINFKYHGHQKWISKKAQIDRFQQIPDPDQHFEYQGAYLWPVADVQPQEIFGSNLEVFDQLRFALKCHIVFDNKLQVFRIYTDKEGAVAEGLKRIEGTLKEYHARTSRNGRTTFVYLVDPHGSSSDISNVRLQTWSSAVAPNSFNYQIPVLTSDKSHPVESTKEEFKSRGMTTSNAIKMQDALRVALENLKYYRGQVRMRLTFGIFTLTKFRWPQEKPSLAFETFKTILALAGTKGMTIRDLGLDQPAFKILDKIYSSNGVFEPLDSAVESLAEVTRTYKARFEINRFEKPTVQLEVEVNSSPFEKELYEKSHSLWTRLDRKDNTVPLDLFMIRLRGGASWELTVSTENQLDGSRIDTKMVDFAASVKMNKVSKTNAELDGRKLFDWETTFPGCLKPSVFEQKIALRYRVKHMPEFVCELARCDRYDVPTNASTPSTTHWEGSMWSSDWDLKLCKNADLGLGEFADWDPRLESFFPNPQPPAIRRQSHEEVEPGLKWFLQNVQMVMESLDRIKGVPPHVRGRGSFH